MKRLVPLSICCFVLACSGNDEAVPDAPAGAPMEQGARPDSPDSSAVMRRSNNVDFDSIIAGLSGAVREEVRGLVQGAREKRFEVAQWLGEAIELEKQARAFDAAGDAGRARSARDEAAGKRRRAKEKLAEARADEARARALASGADATDR